MDLKILLLGGTGAMGTHLAKLLSLRGESVTVTSRKKHQDTNNIHYVMGNAHSINFLTTILQEKDWDVIIDFMGYNTEEFEKRVKKILAATKQYIFLSSARVYGPTNKGELITEKTPRLLDCSTDQKYLQTDEYALTKARQENILQQCGRTNYTIIRPYITFSEIRLQLGVYEKESWLSRALYGLPIVFSRDIATHYTTLTYGKDVSKGIMGIINNPKAYGEIFHITSPEHYHWEDILKLYVDVIEEETGNRPSIVMSDKSINLESKAMQYQVKYCRLFDRCFDNSKILSIVPDLQFGDTKWNLRCCLKEYIRTGNYPIPKPGLMNARLDRIAHVSMLHSFCPTIQSKLKYSILRYAPYFMIKPLIK